MHWPGAALIFFSASISLQALADCTADQGSPTFIEADGVTVTCDATEPNPFTSGIGSEATNTNLTVDIGANAAIDAAGDGVSLANGGSLVNNGEITAGASAVTVVDIFGSEAVTIDNQGSLTATAGAGIDLATTLDNLTVTNAGSIDASTRGIRLSGGQVDNSGSITVTGETAVGIDAGTSSTLTNTGTITSAATGVVDNSGSITNSGRIESTSLGLQLIGTELDNTGEIAVTGSDGVGLDGTGATLLNSGSITSAGAGLNLLDGGSLDNSGTIESVGTAIVQQSGGTITNSGTIRSTAGVGIEAGGGATVTNTGTVEGVGEGIRLTGGDNTLILGGGSNVGGAIRGGADGGSGDALFLEGQGSEDSAIDGFASLTMRGNTWTLSGQVQALAVTVESGRLNIDGSLDVLQQSDSSLVVLSGGELGGQGVINGDVVNSGGTVAAGSPVGTLAIAGDYTQNAAGNLKVSSSSSGQVGLLQVAGVAELAGTVTISAGSDGIYDFLTADGGIEGEFDELAVDGRALVTLVSSGNTLSFVRASTTVEDNTVHAALDSAVLTLDGLSPGGRHYGGGGVWFKALGHYGDRDEREGIAGGDFTIGGGMAGVDWRIGDSRFLVGAGVGATKTDLDIDDGGDGEADNIIYGAYLEYATDVIHGRLTVAGASSEFEHSRSIFVNDQRLRASADYDGDTLGARLSIGAKLPMRGAWGRDWSFEPELRADYLLIDLDPYVEEDGTGLEVSTADDIEAAEFAGLLQVRRRQPDQHGIAPRAHIGVTHRIAIDDREWIAASPAAGSRLLLPGDDEEITAFRFGVGADFALGRHWRETLDYLGETGDDADAHSLVAGIARTF